MLTGEGGTLKIVFCLIFWKINELKLKLFSEFCCCANITQHNTSQHSTEQHNTEPTTEIDKIYFLSL